MNKADLIQVINEIDTGGLNTALEVRGVLNSLLDSTYNDEIKDTHLTNNILNSNGGNYEYEVYTKKTSRQVIMRGWVRSTGSNVFLTFANINNTEYLPKENEVIYGQAYYTAEGFFNPTGIAKTTINRQSGQVIAPIATQSGIQTDEIVTFLITYNTEE